jgi:hypothetical protein
VPPILHQARWVHDGRPTDVSCMNPSGLRVRSRTSGACYRAAFAPDGASVACVGRNVVLWDATRRRRLAWAHPLSHPSEVAFSPSGHELAVKSTSGDCVVLDGIDLGVVLHLGGRQFGEGSPLAFAYDGAMVDGSWNGHLLARDIRSGGTLFQERERGRMVSLVAASPDRELFAYSVDSRGADSLTAVIRTRRWPFSDHEPATLCEATRVHALALNRDLLAGVIDDQVQIRSSATGEVVARRDVPITATWSVAWWPDTDRLVVAGARRFVMFNSALDELWAVDAQYPCDVAISGDGSRALLAAWDGALVVEPR